MERWFVNDCVECGSCTFACPSGIPVVQLIRVAKSALREQQAKARAAAAAVAVPGDGSGEVGKKTGIGEGKAS